MGMAIGSTHSNVRRIEIKNPDGSHAGSISYTLPDRTKKKRLNYNFKAISAELMQTKTSGGAWLVATKALRQAAMLQKKLNDGSYDADEVKNAVSHAKSLERIARKRMKHLRQEELAKRGVSPLSTEMEEAVEESMEEETDLEQMMQLSAEELKKLMKELEETMRELEQENGSSASGQISGTEEEESLDEMLMDCQGSLDLQQLKKKHRSDELREILEADMRYLKALFQKLSREKGNGAAGTAGSANSDNTAATGSVLLELSGAEVPVLPSEIPVSAEGGSMDVCV